MKKTWNKYGPISFIILFFAIIQIQSSLPFLDIIPLKGDVELEKDTLFSWKSWADESYQKHKEEYLNENFGFRELFVRYHNQIYFSFLNTACANDVIIGKENYLFENTYIAALTGKDILSDDVFKSKIDSLVLVKQALKKMGVEFLFVFAPSKSRYYPEYIPDKFGTPSAKSNYSRYKEAIPNAGIDFIDFNKWFCDMKGKAKFPLFSKTGIHWSEYGVALATDSLASFIKKTYHANLPSRKLDSLRLGYRGGNDRDIEDGANLLFDMDVPLMAYPHYQYSDKPESEFSVLTVGDSFYWQIFANDAAAHYFKNPVFYYYFKVAFYHNSPDTDIKNVQIAKEVKSKNLVIFLCMDANLPKFDWGFSKRLLFDLKISDEEYEKMVAEKINSILNTPEWYAAIKEKAAKKNMDLGVVIREDAEYVVNETMKKQFSADATTK